MAEIESSAQPRRRASAAPPPPSASLTFEDEDVGGLSESGSKPPDLRIVHFNDVYHVEAGSKEPVGGAARFQTLCDEYREGARFTGQPGLITLFSGDAFNPSLESSITKGSHMVPILNRIGCHASCVGNHDLDFGVPKFESLASQCKFPWLLANVWDPDVGPDARLANAQPTHMVETSNGLKIGLIGLVEREWLDTINSLPRNIVYKSVSETAKELCPQLRAQGADIVIALTHQREPNDIKLAEKTPPGMIDLILAGHDHIYAHQVVNGTHVLRSGTDFKNLSYIEAWRRTSSADKPAEWAVRITRRDVTSEIPEHPEVAARVNAGSAKLQARMEKPIGFTTAPLDARFTTVRRRESNMGNWVCDLKRLYYGGDCCIMAAGTIRGDQVYGPGVLRTKDIINCFPFEDPCIVLKVTGKAIWDALENGVSQYPALEGRFPQVSNIRFSFDPKQPPGARLRQATIAGHPIDFKRYYKLVTRDYMARGKDGYDMLLYKELGGDVETLVSEEEGLIISMLLRQYLLSIKVLGRWSHWSKSMEEQFQQVNARLHEHHPTKPASPMPSPALAPQDARRPSIAPWHNTIRDGAEDDSDNDSHEEDSDDDDDYHLHVAHPSNPTIQLPDRSVHSPTVQSLLSPFSPPATRTIPHSPFPQTPLSPAQTQRFQRDTQRIQRGAAREKDLHMARRVVRKWARVAGLSEKLVGMEDIDEFESSAVPWTQGISPRVDGRITILGETGVRRYSVFA